MRHGPFITKDLVLARQTRLISRARCMHNQKILNGLPMIPLSKSLTSYANMHMQCSIQWEPSVNITVSLINILNYLVEQSGNGRIREFITVEIRIILL